MDAATLGFGATFSSLATREGLIALDKHFLAQVAAQDPALHENLLAARAAPDALDSKAESTLITSLGPILDAFVAELFGIRDLLDEVAVQTKNLDPIHGCERLFVQRQAVKKYADPSSFNGAALRAELEERMGETLTEASFAAHVETWERDGRKEWLDTALRYAAWATLTADGRAFHRGGTLFRTPHKIDYQRLVPVATTERNGVTMLHLPEHDWRARDG
ncbi:MAG: pyridine nucleotide-disulfide oxidoreductase, partial [Rhodomicrobium sp.]